MADKACFANGQRAVLRRLGQGYVYVEGFALTLGIWWHHGWVADQEDNAIEVTWQEAGARYVGTEIDLRAVAKMASRGWLGSQLDPLEADDG